MQHVLLDRIDGAGFGALGDGELDLFLGDVVRALVLDAQEHRASARWSSREARPAAARSARHNATGARPATRCLPDWSSAIRFGTSSPTISDSIVMPTTTTATAISWPRPCSIGMRSRMAPSRAPSVAPPIAPDRMPISVMPTCTPERKRLGFSASASARAAPREPSSAICCRRRRREETTDISASAKKPFSTMRPTTIASSSQTFMMGMFLHGQARHRNCASWSPARPLTGVPPPAQIAAGTRAERPFICRK